MNKLVKLVLVAAVALEMVGCASVGGASKKYINNTTKSGVIYGVNAKEANVLGSSNSTIASVCKDIDNKDARCFEQDKYKIVVVMAKYGYMDAFTGMISLAPKDMNVGEPCNSSYWDQKNCTYVKSTVEAGKLGTVTDVVSRPGENKCHWGGMPAAGGVVCPTYNYDYSKDFNGIPR